MAITFDLTCCSFALASVENVNCYDMCQVFTNQLWEEKFDGLPAELFPFEESSLQTFPPEKSSPKNCKNIERIKTL